MSMYDVESFAEGAVMFIHNLNIPANGKIELIHNIYRFHDMLGTGFTKLRVYDILVHTNYFRLFLPWEDPSAERYTEIYSRMKSNGVPFEFIYSDIPEEGSGDSDITCYWLGEVDGNVVNSLCCDAGQPIWSVLTGKPAPKNMKPIDLIVRLAEHADIVTNYEVKADLFYIAFMYLLGDDCREQAERLKDLLFSKETVRIAGKNWSHVFDIVGGFNVDEYPVPAEWLNYYTVNKP